MMNAMVSVSVQVTTLRVMIAPTFSSSAAGPRSPIARTMSRSDRMPATRLSGPVTTTAPMRRSPSSFTASDRLAVGAMVTTSLPLRDKIVRTVMGSLPCGKRLAQKPDCSSPNMDADEQWCPSPGALDKNVDANRVEDKTNDPIFDAAVRPHDGAADAPASELPTSELPAPRPARPRYRAQP